jgi:16S rRNA (guanine966-N2)-methyltransferase
MGMGEQRMRIVAGRFRGRALRAPGGETTRPTTDRVREAVFSALSSIAGSDLGGGVVLDAFAGSGALGLEALSRGCAHAVLVEQDRGALAAIRSNVETFDAAADATIVAGDVFQLAERGRLARSPYSLLLLDPPYRLDAARVASLVAALAENGQLEDGAVVVWEHGVRADVEWPAGFSAYKRKRYGTTEVDIAVFARGA